MYATTKINKFYKTKHYYQSNPRKQPGSKNVFLAKITADSSELKKINVHVVSASHVAQLKPLIASPLSQSTHLNYRPAHSQLLPYTSHYSAQKYPNKIGIFLAVLGCVVAISLIVIVIGPGFDKVASILAML